MCRGYNGAGRGAAGLLLGGLGARRMNRDDAGVLAPGSCSGAARSREAMLCLFSIVMLAGFTGSFSINLINLGLQHRGETAAAIGASTAVHAHREHQLRTMPVAQTAGGNLEQQCTDEARGSERR